MSDLLLVAGLTADVIDDAPVLMSSAPARPVADTRPRALNDRDEFGALDGAPGVFQAPLEPAGLAAREDLGHALCAWLPREHRL